MQNTDDLARRPRMSDSDVTRLLRQAGDGDEKAQERLIARIYDELRRMAGAQLRAERSDHTLQPTELVVERVEGPVQ